MSGIDKETDQVLIAKREGQMEAFKQGEYYQYWDVHCLCKDQFKEPDCKMRYTREANFQRKRFEWSNSISEWVSEHRQQQAISQPSPEDPFEPAPPMEDDDPFQPDPFEPPPSNSPLGLSKPEESFVKQEKSNNLMPSRRQRRPPKQEPIQEEAPKQASPAKSGSLASLLGALDKNMLQELKNKPAEDEVIEGTVSFGEKNFFKNL